MGSGRVERVGPAFLSICKTNKRLLSASLCRLAILNYVTTTVCVKSVCVCVLGEGRQLECTVWNNLDGLFAHVRAGMRACDRLSEERSDPMWRAYKVKISRHSICPRGLCERLCELSLGHQQERTSATV